MVKSYEGVDELVPFVDSLKKKKKLFGERRVVGNLHRFIPAKKNFGPPPTSEKTWPFSEQSEDVMTWWCGPVPRVRPSSVR